MIEGLLEQLAGLEQRLLVPLPCQVTGLQQQIECRGIARGRSWDQLDT